MKQFYNKQKWLKKTIAMVIVCLCGTALTAVAQTISGDCSGAQQITVGNCTSNQNVSNTTVNDPTVSGCNTSAARDGWFYFVAGTTRSTVYFNNNSSRNAAIHVYTGTCASLTQVACMNDNGGGSDETVTFNTTAGTTYRVRIVHTSGTTSTLNGSVCVYNAPAILSFSPSPICTGATVTITGTSFTGTTAVSINGTAASSFTVVNSTTITAVVAAATTSGVISVTSPNGTSTSASSLTVNTTPVATSTPASRTLCESGNANLALTSNVGATSFTWTVVQTNVSGASDCAASCGTNISQTVSNVNGTSAGTAVYTITPATATCTGNPINVTVTANPKPVGTPSDATPDICGPAGPAVSLSSSLGGTSYTWTVSQSGVTGGSNCSSGCGSSINQTLTASGVTPGTAIYTVTPTASSCAGNTFTVAVTVKPKPVASATPTTQTLCSPAAASIGLSSTVSGSTFAWTAFQSGVTGATAGSGSSIAQTISTTGAGQGTATYTVTPTADGCNGNTITTSVVVNPPPSVSLSSSAADICIGSSATLTATSSGGTLGSISGSNTTSGSIPDNSVTGLSRTITLPAGIMTAATNLTVTLNIAHTWVGDLIVTLTGPCGTTIIFDRPGVPASTNGNGNNLSGTYVFTSTAAGGLSETGTVGAGTYKPTDAAGAVHNFNGLTFPCLNIGGVWTLNVSDRVSVDTGTLTSWSISVSNAIPYTTAYSGPATIGAIAYSGTSNNTATSSVTPPLGLNTYTVVTTDGVGCTATNSVNVEVNNIPAATATPSSQSICSGGSITDILLGTSNSVSGTTFSWTRDNTSGVTGIAGSGSGDITGSLTNTTNAPVTVTFTITPTGPAPTHCVGSDITATVLVNPTPVASSVPASQTICEGASTNFALTSTVAGTTFSWTVVQDPDVSGASAGSGSSIVQTLTNSGAATENATYTISSSANGCPGSDITVVAGVSSVLSATASWVSDASCNGGTDGVASYSATGGTTPYSVSPAITGLSAGTYTFTVTDATGCTATTGAVTINEPTALVPSCSVVSHVSCNGLSDGAADVTASGGTAPYTGTGSFTGLAAGTYSYNVSDANGCTASCSVTITEPAVLSASCSVVSHVSCNGGTDGAADVTASGGTSPYTGTGSFTGLAAGTYTYNVSDANGCTASCSVTITEPAALVATCSVVSHVSCNGLSDGAADVTASGGTAPYTGTGSFTGLAAGTYTYNVSDANGCTASCSVTITEPAVLTSICTPVNESFPGASDGSVTIVASGGTAPYTGDGLFSGLTAGTYTYTVSDANGCTTTCSATVGSNCTPSTDPTGATASSANVCLGNSVTLSVTGGSLGTNADWVWYEGGCAAGTSIGTGASISVTVTTLGSHTYFVRAEGLCGTTICMSVSVNGITVLPAPITILSAPASGCVGGSGNVTCSSVAGATGYYWTAPAGVLINGVPGPVTTVSTTVTVTFIALPPSGISGWNVCVSGINACGTSPNTKCYWIRATISTPSPLVGSVVGCPGSSGTYSVTPVDGAAQYVWSITGAAGLNGGGATVTTTVPSVSVDFAPGFVTGQLCVYAKTSCGYSGGSRCLTIAAAPGMPGAISGSTTICPGSSSVYSIAAVPGAASYVWTTTGAGTSVIGSGTTATVNTTAGFTSGSVCVVAVSSCGAPIGNSAQRCKTIGTGKLATPGNITGDPTTGVCGQTYQYSIPSIAGATLGYSWSVPGNVTIIGSSNANTITLQFPSNFVSGTICVSGLNGCGNGFSRCVNVFGNPGTPGTISGSTSVCVGGTEVYTWPASPGATSYQVFVPVGATVLTGTPTVSTSAVILWGTTAGNVGVKAVNGCGVSGTRTLPVSISCRVAQTVNESNGVDTKVYPNPAHGQFNVSFNAAIAENFKLKVLDQTGRIVKQEVINAQEGNNVQQLEVSELAPGIYLVVLESKQTGLSKYPLLLQ